MPLFSKTLAGWEGHYPSADDSNPDSFRPNGLPRGTSLRLNNWAHLQFSNGWSFVDFHTISITCVSWLYTTCFLQLLVASFEMQITAFTEPWSCSCVPPPQLLLQHVSTASLLLLCSGNPSGFDQLLSNYLTSGRWMVSAPAIASTSSC